MSLHIDENNKKIFDLLDVLNKLGHAESTKICEARFGVSSGTLALTHAIERAMYETKFNEDDPPNFRGMGSIIKASMY